MAPENAHSPGSHSAEQLSVTNPSSTPEASGVPTPTDEGAWRPFPDYILIGHINLHKSPECAATLARHIAKQYDFLRVNSDGIISSEQLEINRDPTQYGGYRDGKPLSVSEWKKLQKGKAVQQSDSQSNPAEDNNPDGPVVRGR